MFAVQERANPRTSVLLTCLSLPNVYLQVRILEAEAFALEFTGLPDKKTNHRATGSFFFASSGEDVSLNCVPTSTYLENHMKTLLRVTLALVLHAGFLVPAHASAQVQQADRMDPLPDVVWQSKKAEHVYGFPELKKHKTGTLTIDPHAITFTGKSGTSSIERKDVKSVSSGNQRVELWA